MRLSILSLLALTFLAALPLAYWSYRTRRDTRIDECVLLIKEINRGNNENPVTIIEALNELKRLGHSGAIETLYRFDKEYEFSNQNIDLLVPLLFSQRPGPIEETGPSIRKAHAEYGHANIEIVDGIPFATNIFPINYSGFAYSRSDVIERADELMVIRRPILLPTNDPFATSEQFINQLIQDKQKQFAELDDHVDEIPSRVTRRIQNQVFQMIEHLVPDAETPAQGDWPEHPELWQELRGICLERGLAWCDNRESYIFTR